MLLNRGPIAPRPTPARRCRPVASVRTIRPARAARPLPLQRFAPMPYTGRAAAHQRYGLGGPKLGAAAAPIIVRGFFVAQHGIPSQWRAVWGGVKAPAGPSPVRQPRTVCRPLLAGSAAGLKTCLLGAMHG